MIIFWLTPELVHIADKYVVVTSWWHLCPARGSGALSDSVQCGKPSVFVHVGYFEIQLHRPQTMQNKVICNETHHDNEKQTLILHIHYIQIFVWEKFLFCTFTVTKLASDYLLAAYHMFLMFVIHFRKTRHLKQLSVLSSEAGIYKGAKLQVLLWRPGFHTGP